MITDNNRTAVFFFMQAGISLITMSFAIAMMVKSSDNIQIFLPVLTSISAYWLPAPTPPPSISGMFETTKGEETENRTNDVETGKRDEEILPSKRILQLSKTPHRRELDTGSSIPPIGFTLQGAE